MQLRLSVFFLSLGLVSLFYIPSWADDAMASEAQVFSDREDLRTRFSKLSQNGKEKNRALALKAAKRGRDFFDRGLFKKAGFYFLKSIQHDPDNDTLFYEYGVTLYKLDENRKAAHYLSLVESSSAVDQTELHYYQGLVHYKLKENELALAKFKNVREDKDPKLSPLAAMYAGILEASSENYRDAKANFEYVLDNSKDPALDKRAENYIESILRTQQFQESAKQKWAFSAFAGAAYDENVLNAAITNASTDTAAYRMIYGGAINYKALYSLKHTLIPQVYFSDMYSLDKKFKSDATVQSADPMQGEISVPYKRYFRSGTLTVSPAYQVLYMSLDESSRDLVFDTFALSTAYSMPHSGKWISEVRVDLAKDKSHIQITNPADDQSSNKYTVVLSNTRLLDSEAYKSITIDVMYTNSDTDGANFRYTRYLAAVGAGFPITESKTVLGYLRVDYFNMDFSDSASQREDKGTVATMGTTYALSTKTNMSFNLQYYANSSNVALFDYDKIVLTGIYTFSSGFF